MIKRYEFMLPEGLSDRCREQAGILSRETFFVTEYISRHLKSSALRNERIGELPVKRLIVTLNSKKNDIRFFVDYGQNILNCEITFNYGDVFPLRGVERIKKIIEAVIISADYYESCVNNLGGEIRKAVNLFERGGYKNIWIHKKKLLKGIGVANLECELTSLYFTLSFVVANKSKEIFRKRLVKTPPDPIFYHDLFRDLVMEGEVVYVVDRIFKKPIYAIRIEDIIRGLSGVLYPVNDYKVDDNTNELILSKELSPRKTKWWDDFVECFQNDVGTPCPKGEFPC